ncbi:ATP-binding cassette subfamily B protein/subfamily B ATP-binding cassette protein MsbA [Salirhabdus euzebyi]|uniref:ATP-binding cassette subfamily B protein/subfamily B ATP-binding cassette protein MsbA n=1 Tax=Salirhabdus euzebyi TaxID=394506 RepID=A0A841Q364_9BACI|nr:ABC transporter ATP-binding protein [Salirhabdus euzebyi]MBB6452718.1 ATP-binding cassette subfamily B protein/subfamily B ATP-binding cassette protein MsbA [Salirhabdus euzebyi]
MDPSSSTLKPSHLFKIYLWAISFLKPYRKLFFLIVMISIFVTGIELLIPKFIQYFIDVIVPERNSSLFFFLLSGMVVLVLVMIYFRTVENNLQRHVQERAARDIHFSIFQHLRRLGFSYFEKHPVGETLSLMNTEVTAFQDLYRRFLPFMIREAVFSTIAVILMFTVNVQLALIIIPSFLLYYAIGPRFEKKASELSRDLSTNRISLNQKIYESLSALIEVRSYSAENWEMERLNEKVDTYNKTMVKAYLYAYLRGTVRRLSYYGGAIAILIYGSFLVQDGSLSVGEFSTFLLYYFAAMHRLTSVITSLTEQRVLMYQIDKIYQFMKVKPDIVEAEQPRHIRHIKGQVSFQNVSFRYPGSGDVLKKFHLHVDAGKRVAIVGTSGNGKSTMLKLLGRFYDPNEGKILLDGVPLTELSISQLREAIGFVFQETYLFGSSVRENIKFGDPSASDEQIEAAAKAAYAHDFIIELENGYDTLIGERGIKLSGGQKQRIAIARMFLKNPQIILLDEATAALDNVSELAVQKALDDLLQGRTTFTVAHRLSTIQDYDQIIVLHNGTVAEQGTYEELMHQKGLFFELAEGEQKRIG